jgi:predicted metal-dependent peptidase
VAVEITDQFRLCSQSIEQAVLELFRRDPFYAHIALRLPRIIDPLVATASVGISGLGIVLRINPTFWMSLKLLKYRVAILKHELLHIALDHLVRQSTFSNSRLFNIAADLAINDLYIGSDELPEGALLISDFSAANVHIGDSTEKIYRALEEFLALEESNDDADQKNCRKLIKELLQQDRHKEWSLIGDAQSRQEMQRGVQEALDRAMQEHGQDFALDSEIRHAIASTTEQCKPALDWRRTLKIFACSSRRTSVVNTMKRASRRFGTVPGTRIKKRTNLVVVIDTSGSISPPDLSRFLSEVDRIWRAGADVEIVEADDCVNRISQYRGHPIGELQGGGGTDFDPAIRYASERALLDGVIYFTDGEGSLSLTCRKPVLWLITPNGITEDSNIWEQMTNGRNRVVKMNQDT